MWRYRSLDNIILILLLMTLKNVPLPYSCSSTKYYIWYAKFVWMQYWNYTGVGSVFQPLNKTLVSKIKQKQPLWCGNVYSNNSIYVLILPILISHPQNNVFGTIKEKEDKCDSKRHSAGNWIWSSARCTWKFFAAGCPFDYIRWNRGLCRSSHCGNAYSTKLWTSWRRSQWM